MYLRTARRKNADGSVVEYHQLAENVWDAEKGCAVAKVVYSFGRADQLDRAALRRGSGVPDQLKPPGKPLVSERCSGELLRRGGIQ
jgi:hypothetical protein